MLYQSPVRCALRAGEVLVLRFFPYGWHRRAMRYVYRVKECFGGVRRKAGDGMLPERQRFIGAGGG